MNDYRYTWTFSKDSRFLRFYAWMWDANPRNADFCKLFWGYVFSWFAIFIRVFYIFYPLVLLGRKLKARWQKYPARPAPPPEKEGPSRGERFLSKLSEFFSRSGVRAFFHWVGIGIVVILGLGILGTGTWGVVLLIQNIQWHGTLIGLMVFGITVAAGIAVFGLIVLCVWLDESGRFGRMGEAIKTFFRFLGDGIHAVKTNTCPRITITDE